MKAPNLQATIRDGVLDRAMHEFHLQALKTSRTPSFFLIHTLTGLLTLLNATAELKVAGIFSDHGVLQHGVPVPVWGTATPEAEVSVEFAEQQVTLIAGAEGLWKLELEPLLPSPLGRKMLIRTGEQIVEIQDLLVGEVWYASGQSNMAMTLAACAKGLEEVAETIASSETKPIRTLRIETQDSATPLTDFAEAPKWQIDSPENRPGQSAAAYYFASVLHETLQVPVGIIEGAWGGKPIEGFIPRAQFDATERLRQILALSDAEDFEALQALEGGVIIRNTAGRLGRIYHARVAPVAPYAIKGFLWYQGESNAGKGEDPRHYREKMETLVSGWRAAWGQDDLPFYFVQLPSFDDKATGWIRLREEQRLSLQIPNTGMAVTIDLRDPEIHPPNKVDVGKRLAALALANTYGQSVSGSGPLFESATVEGKTMRATFSHAEGGLMIAEKTGLADPVETPGGSVAHVELADAEGTWFPANARVEGSDLIAESPQVENPFAIRYACEGHAEAANLYDRAGLPASPFCSDLARLPWERAE